MPVLDDFLNAVRNTMAGDPQAGQQLGGYAARWAHVLLDEEQQTRVKALFEWANRVQAKSGAKWYPVTVVQPCTVRSQLTSCDARAVGTCACCGRPVCLLHAMLSMEADLLCAPCFAVARQHAKMWTPSEQDRYTSEEDIEEAYRVLDVDPDDDMDTIRSAYKKKLRQNHPDTRKTEAAKTKAQERFKRIRWAWDVIEKARSDAR